MKIRKKVKLSEKETVKKKAEFKPKVYNSYGTQQIRHNLSLSLAGKDIVRHDKLRREGFGNIDIFRLGMLFMKKNKAESIRLLTEIKKEQLTEKLNKGEN